ncbi:hypothetical protein COU20_00635 [Candidatus Kaiserbacteria bacterium CG10_big_fil_rev_8_21_14_0_10_59_10]|uniref:Uncharacterized protein n=1 Tax=Candidatus Kaiserbacteria bacterium CG10_big_fil_rev_8_21_14_0_10_59_10 TaxID=1974612 RepID=A0A2H0U8W4_9BACT|nr:MAG: hypothetical protein COU20_00635 [Candidatus Kaiserbacteria bacterium CG10_big_fil_rev_8_21_14_0_10_59_10]
MKKITHTNLAILLSIVCVAALAGLAFLPGALSAQVRTAEEIRTALVESGIASTMTQESIDASVANVLRMLESGELTYEGFLNDLDFEPFDQGPLSAGGGVSAGIVSCFDYYTFGSVQVHATANVSTAVSGTPVTFVGEIVNDNPYPIVDGALYVKIFRMRDEPDAVAANGPDVVDQFFVRDNIALPAHGTLPIVFSWDIPSFAQSGEYAAAAFFTTSKKYNLLGLSFTDDVVGNQMPFLVMGERNTTVKFDKDSVRVNGNAYLFAAFPPRADSSSPVVITASVRNDTGEGATVPVTWRLYQWDAQRNENLIDTFQTTVTVPAGGSAPVSFVADDVQYPVYLAIGTVQWRNTESIINVRFVREGVDRTRINFPGITSFPLRKGEQTTLFSCLHGSGESALVPDGRLELRLTDETGREIHSHTYTGGVTGAMMGIASAFTPRRDYNVVHLNARLYQGNQLVDDARLVYDCNEIDPSLCTEEGAATAGFMADVLTLLIAIAGGLALLGAAAWVVVRMRARDAVRSGSAEPASGEGL